jgi:hypothetical protein
MPHPCPHHCPPEGGSGLGAAAAAVVLVLIAAAVAGPVIHAAEIALQILVITAGCLAAAALVTVATVIAVRLRRRQLAARPPVRLVSSRPAQSLPAPRPAIEAPRTRPAAAAVNRERTPRVP